MVMCCMGFVCRCVGGGGGWWLFFFCQAEDGIRDLVRSRGLGDVYKRQEYQAQKEYLFPPEPSMRLVIDTIEFGTRHMPLWNTCLLYTSDAADERSSVDLGGRRIIKKKTRVNIAW